MSIHFLIITGGIAITPNDGCDDEMKQWMQSAEYNAWNLSFLICKIVALHEVWMKTEWSNVCQAFGTPLGTWEALKTVSYWYWYCHCDFHGAKTGQLIQCEAHVWGVWEAVKAGLPSKCNMWGESWRIKSSVTSENDGGRGPRNVFNSPMQHHIAGFTQFLSLNCWTPGWVTAAGLWNYSCSFAAVTTVCNCAHIT